MNLGICNSNPSGECDGTVDVGATNLAVSYATLLDRSFDQLGFLTWGVEEGYMASTFTHAGAVSAHIDLVSPSATTVPGNHSITRLLHNH